MDEQGGALAQQAPLRVEMAVVRAAAAGGASVETYCHLAERRRRGASAHLRWHKGRCCFQRCFVTNFDDSSASPPAKHPTLRHRRRNDEKN